VKKCTHQRAHMVLSLSESERASQMAHMHVCVHSHGGCLSCPGI
jgi:hypothetical protein